MKLLGIFFLTFIFIGASEAITANVFSNSNCVGSPSVSYNVALNDCKDMSQGGQTMSIKAIVCNSTMATLSSYGSSTCSGAVISTTNAVPNVCTIDGSDWVKIDCADSIVKSSSSEIFLSIGAIIATIISLFNL